MRHSDKLKELIEINHKLSLILGFATTTLLETCESIGAELSEPIKIAVEWVLEATENVVYLNKALPPFPHYR